jgi:hypothetical protein|tara:strand:+ start:72 stop:638 length:567 start_codon:yes stop_codon:yes gene_type:complete
MPGQFDAEQNGYWGGNLPSVSDWADILASYNSHITPGMDFSQRVKQDLSGIAMVPSATPIAKWAEDPDFVNTMPTTWANPDITYNMPIVDSLSATKQAQVNAILAPIRKSKISSIVDAVKKGAKSGGKSKGKRGRTTAAPASGPHGGGMTSSKSAAAGGWGTSGRGEFDGGFGDAGMGEGMGGFGGWT